MTGYGRATAAIEGFSLTVQVSSVNRKTLDLAVNVPSDWEVLEADIGEQVRKVATRGRIHVVVELTGAQRTTEAAWDDAEVHAALDRLAVLANARGLPFQPTPELLWAVASAQRRPVEMPTAEEAAKVVRETVAEALRSFAAMRAQEGEALLVDFLARSRHARRRWRPPIARCCSSGCGRPGWNLMSRTSACCARLRCSPTAATSPRNSPGCAATLTNSRPC
jgi:uncharacterized protein YicC (UPF0701 family)